MNTLSANHPLYISTCVNGKKILPGKICEKRLDNFPNTVCCMYCLHKYKSLMILCLFFCETPKNCINLLETAAHMHYSIFFKGSLIVVKSLSWGKLHSTTFPLVPLLQEFHFHLVLFLIKMYLSLPS